MKKYIFIMILSLMLCGCGCSNKNTNKIVDNSAIGREDVSYKLEITCGDKVKESNVVLNKDKTATYSLYECNNNILELTNGSGTYKVNGSNVVITGSYSETININVKNEQTIDVTFDKLRQTLTK